MPVEIKHIKPYPVSNVSIPCPCCGAFKKYIDFSGKWYCAWCGYVEGERVIGKEGSWPGKAGVPY